MTDQNQPKTGDIAWRDLTVSDAKNISQFYHDVIGWEILPQDMGDYQDFNVVNPSTKEVIAGICHARGSNANLPPHWLMYVIVENVDQGAHKCLDAGGAIIDGPRPLGSGRFCVIQNPAGAHLALYQTE